MFSNTIKFLFSRFINLNRILNRNLTLIHDKAYINGCWVNSECKLEVCNPYDGSLVGTVPDMGEKEASGAVDCAYEAFQTWQDTTPKYRAELLHKWYLIMKENIDELATINTLECGKSWSDSIADIKYGNSFVEWFAEQARRIAGEITDAPSDTKLMFLVKQPIGVAGLITPWNFPHALVTRKASAALAAGCTIVIKPSEETPLTALAIADLSERAGFPPGVINVITASRENGKEIGTFLCQSKKVAGISFTGSSETGKILYKLCGDGIKRLALELGGNAPFIVFKSANIEKAINGALVSKLRNCGQTCISSNRFIIHESLFDCFVCELKKEMEKQVLGDGLDKNVTLGPLINKSQLEKVAFIVEDAIKKGAKVVTGAKRACEVGELFYEPTILTNIQENMICYKEEIFGPVACCMDFSTEVEAIKIANDTSAGLAAYFYTEDVAQMFRVAKHLEFGMIGMNEGLISSAEAAFGGIKESGIGREGSWHGIEDFIYIKYLCLGNMKLSMLKDCK